MGQQLEQLNAATGSGTQSLTGKFSGAVLCIGLARQEPPPVDPTPLLSSVFPPFTRLQHQLQALLGQAQSLLLVPCTASHGCSLVYFLMYEYLQQCQVELSAQLALGGLLLQGI